MDQRHDDVDYDAFYGPLAAFRTPSYEPSPELAGDKDDDVQAFRRHQMRSRSIPMVTLRSTSGGFIDSCPSVTEGARTGQRRYARASPVSLASFPTLLFP